MLKMFHYMKERWYYVVMIIVLLFVQAYCDLSLPDYTSKIVNVGIQQKGIEDDHSETQRVMASRSGRGRSGGALVSVAM